MLLFDDSEEGGVRVTVAGPQDGVRLAKEALQALLVSALSACNHPDDTQATYESTQHAPGACGAGAVQPVGMMRHWSGLGSRLSVL